MAKAHLHSFICLGEDDVSTLSPSPCVRDNASVATLPADSLQICGEILFDSVGCSLLLLDASGHITYANKLAASMTGYTCQELTRLRFEEVFREARVSDLAFSEDKNHLGTMPRIGERVHGTVCCKDGVNITARVHLKGLPGQNGRGGMQVATLEDLRDYQQMAEYVDLVTHYDLQTGLPKVETVFQQVGSAILQLQASSKAFALLEIRMDELGRISESLGLEAADVAVRAIGSRLSSNLDADKQLVRTGTDGFFVLLADCESRDKACQEGSRLVQLFEQPFQIQGYSVCLTASIGVSYAESNTATRASVFAEAEIAVRRSKSLGGNQVSCFEPTMADWHCRAVQTEAQLRTALEREELFLVYQPQFCLKTGKLTGVEALVRWASPERGLVMPNDFIPLAEETGLIVQLGEWCLRTACRDIAALQKQIGRQILLAVNISPRQVHAKGFLDVVNHALEESGLDPKCLELEITEGLLIKHEAEALQVLAKIQNQGVSVAMDDFGMGFSNLSYITRLNVNRLKIDRSFVARCTEDRSHEMIMTSILFLARSLEMDVVAEGVETAAQASMLAGLQCNSAQGYLFARPTTLDEILKLAEVQPSSRLSIWQTALESEIENETAPAVPDARNAVNVGETPSQEVSAAAPLEKMREVALQVRASATSERAVKPAGVACGEPRDPVCRPVYPKRVAGSVKVRLQAVPDEAAKESTRTPKESAYVPKFQLLS
ncbi:EAL domain-containing protein [Terriglobus sp.]|uniref:sensor domain-containing protein n=1 Tax=Terriglobus sp. TaxID=1889013 RepID=UPI003B00C491